MKIVVFELREDEIQELDVLVKEHKLDIVTCSDPISQNNIDLVKDCSGITILGRSTLDQGMLDNLKRFGVKSVSTRTIGFDHIDIEYAKKIGIKVSSATYAPNGVADFAIMLMLLAIRKYKPVLWRQNVNDYSLSGLMGKEMRNLTVGVIGTGKIGSTVIEALSGFQCKILAYDPYENEKIIQYAKYVDLETLYRSCDMISIHLPLSEETRYMINKETISKMKDGVILINTSRGELMDIQSLIAGIESEKIGALGLDVLENEQGIYHADRKVDILKNRDMAYLRQFPNVVMTPHMAFYTDAGIKSMVRCGIEGLL